MKIIGTGLSGLVGSRIVELLGERLDFTDFSLDTQIDITNRSQLEQAFKSHPDGHTVIHLAAFTDVNRAWEQRGDKSGLCYRVNVVGTKNIAQLCAENNKYLLHISTDFVFAGQRPPAGGYRETDQPKPIEWYGQTKYLAEQEVQKSGANYCLARIAFPFRAHFPPKLDLVRKIIKGFKENSLAPMFTDQIITPTFVDDIAVGINALINQRANGIYHLVGSSKLSPFELALRIAEVFGFEKKMVKKGSLTNYVQQSGRPRQKNLVLSNQKISRLGVKMKTIDQALKVMKSQ